MILKSKTEHQETQLDGRDRWFAFHTRARHEKSVNTRLNHKGIEVYLPLVPRERQWHDRRKVVEWPLFPSYVFARTRRDSLFQVLDTPGVAGVVRLGGRPVPVPDEDIENVRRFAEAVAETGNIPEPEPLVSEGQRVRVVSGPLEGVEGLVIERRGGGRTLLQVGLEAIGQGLKVEVDIASLHVLPNGLASQTR
jgi:transcriptional antiterminator RfaH